MKDETKTVPAVFRYLLGILLMSFGLSALGGGSYGFCGARGMPLELLQGSPFHDYRGPSLILFFIVGGSLLVASVGVLGSFRLGRSAAILSGWILLLWITAQISIIGYLSRLQMITMAAALGILILAWLLPQPVDNPKAGRLH